MMWWGWMDRSTDEEVVVHSAHQRRDCCYFNFLVVVVVAAYAYALHRSSKGNWRNRSAKLWRWLQSARLWRWLQYTIWCTNTIYHGRGDHRRAAAHWTVATVSSTLWVYKNGVCTPITTSQVHYGCIKMEFVSLSSPRSSGQQELAGQWIGWPRETSTSIRIAYSIYII